MKPDTKRWLTIAESDFDASQYLWRGSRYPQALYFIFQALEKVLKGTQIELTNTEPQKTHRLEDIAKLTKLDFSKEDIQSLKGMSQDYGRVRYSDYAQTKYNTKKKTESIYIKGKNIYLWILEQLNHH